MHHAKAMGWLDCELIGDLGSGLNFRKRGLLRLLDLLVGRSVCRLVVENKDRLLRFGADLVFRLCRCLGIEVAVVDAPADRSFEADLARDVLEIITVFSARLYGARSAARRKNTAPAAI